MEKLFHLGLNLPLSYNLIMTGFLLFIYMSSWWLVALVKKRADIADIAWGFGFILVAWSSLFLGQVTVYGLILNTLVTVWALRLAFHIYYRSKGREEDFRYQALKQRWGTNFNLRLFSDVFLLQGCILYIVALPIMWIHTHPGGVSLDVLGAAFSVWLVGFIVEAISDYELALFRKDLSNKGKLLTTGLWGYVRHPNYLGELIQWWAIWLMAALLPFGWVLCISPLLLTYLILEVSGVRPLEEKMKKHPEFEAYAEATPSLIPPSLVNGMLYAAAWIILIYYGAQGFLLLPLIVALGCYALQVALFAKFDAKSLGICIPLSIFTTILGFLQEMFFIYTGTLAYPNKEIFPPLWLLLLYPLFSLTLNSSLSFLNKNLLLSFFLGGVGGVFSYISGERLGGVQLLAPQSYPILFISWALFLTVLIIVNRKLIAQKEGV